MLDAWGFLRCLVAFLLLAAGAQAQPPLPLITLVGAEVGPQFPEPGNGTTVTVFVRNDSQVAMPGPVALDLWVYSSTEQGTAVAGDWERPPRVIVPQLDPGQTWPAESPAVFLESEGLHAVEVALFHAYTSEQIRVGNSTLKHLFHVTRPADLRAGGAMLDAYGRVAIWVKNTGHTIPGDHFQAATVTLQIGSDTYSRRLAEVDPAGRLRSDGSNGTAHATAHTWPSQGPSGVTLDRRQRHNVQVTIDPGQAVHDLRRANNSRRYQIGGMPDLVVCSRKFKHSEIQRIAEYTAWVKNIGNAPSRRSVDLRFRIEKKGVKHFSIPPLSVNETYGGVHRKVLWSKQADRNFSLNVDSRGEIEELDDDNNLILGEIFVRRGTGTLPVGFDELGPLPEIKCSDKPGMADPP